MPRVPKAIRNQKGRLHNPPKNAGQLLIEGAALLRTKGVESPNLSCILLLSKVLGKSKEFLFAHPELDISGPSQEEFYALVERLINGEPMAYIIGEREFWAHSFLCTPSALIPRPETELLVETAIEWFGEGGPRRILDLGTGTGAVGISLAAKWKESRVILTDIDWQALSLARMNFNRIIGPEGRVELVCGDWFQPFRPGFKADLITVNPPYVSRLDEELLQDSVRRYEPERALFSRDESGLSEIKTLFGQAAGHLEKGGLILCEVGIGQASAVIAFVESLGKYRDVRIFKDLSGIERVVAAAP